jgi:pimeloyl-ACP methyl ester carboxylesterase
LVTLPPVLLAHGFASSFEYNWRLPGFADLLEDAGRTVIPFDFPGHGTAPKSHDPEDYADLAGALATALPDEGEVDAVGFSMGAMALLRLASRVPERFRKVVVAGVGENVFRDQDPESVAAAIEAGAAPDGEVGTQLFVHFSEVPGNDPKALAACMRRMRDAMTAEDVAKITCPVLVVLGDKDFAGPADPLMDALPNGKLVMLRNTEHFHTPKSFAFWDAALDFLDASV